MCLTAQFKVPYKLSPKSANIGKSAREPPGKPEGSHTSGMRGTGKAHKSYGALQIVFLLSVSPTPSETIGLLHSAGRSKTEKRRHPGHHFRSFYNRLKR